MKIEGRGGDYGVVHLQTTSEVELIEFISREIRFDSKKVLELIELGAVYVNGHRTLDADLRLTSGTHVRVHSEPRRYLRPQLKSRLIHQEECFLIVDKPSGLPVHALTDNLRDNVVAILEEELQRRIFITHRLDIETSGLLVLALNFEAQAKINSDIATRKVKRQYAALTQAPVRPGDYVHFMEPSPTAPKRVSEKKFEGWLECRLKVLDCNESMVATQDGNEFAAPNFELKIELQTGRTQQIRSQLSALGAPILGDVIYGGALGSPKTIALRASSIEINGRVFTAPR